MIGLLYLLLLFNGLLPPPYIYFLFFAFSFSTLRVFVCLPTFRLKAERLKAESKMQVRESLYRLTSKVEAKRSFVNMKSTFISHEG
jgi:hypothetical protein